jgi:LacI family transcriptional regulator
MKNLTLEEIGKLAGVSRGTVSRVINNHPHVSEKARERVLEVIEQTGYLPNLAARSLASQKSKILGLVFPRSVQAFFSDPYFPRFTQGVAQACNEKDYTLSLFIFYSAEDEQKLFPRISQRGQLDGVIVQATTANDPIIASIREGEIPCVFAGRAPKYADANFVDVDNRSGAYIAVSHLVQLGRQRIATITGPLDQTAGMDRKEGYIQALRDRNRSIDENLISVGDFSQVSGYHAASNLLPHKPDAIFVASDVMAIGAMQAIYEAKLKVPDDIAIVGFDDLPPAKYASPPLTTIRQPIMRLGCKAVEMLLDIVDNGSYSPQRMVFDTQLVIRESCGSKQERITDDRSMVSHST